MHRVTAEQRQLSQTELRTRAVRHWDVLPACEAPFKRELNAIATMKSLVDALESKPWWVRFDNFHLVFRAQYQYLRRNKGRREAFRTAAKVSTIFWMPEPVASWLVKRWKPKPRPCEQGELPKVVPLPPSSPSPVPR